MTRIACRLTGAEESELGRTLWLFTYFLLVITAYYVVKPVRTSLFLESLGSAYLPHAYIGTALFVGVAVWAYGRLVDRLGRSQVVGVTWGACGLTLLGFWAAFQSPGMVTSALFYFFSAVFSVLGVTQFWSFAADVVDSQQAKRTYGFIGSGGILGGLAGGSLTGLLANRIGTEQLLLIASGLCFVCGAIGVFLSRRYPSLQVEAKPAAAPGTPAASTRGGLSLVLSSKYLLLIAGIVMCVQLVSTMIDFEFTSVVDAAYPLKDGRTAFLGGFLAAMNLLGFLIQFFLTSPIQQTFGVGPSLMLLPVVSVFTSSAFFLWPVLGAAVVMRMCDNALGYSLSQATRELLYQPTSRDVKYKAKAFIDMFVYRFGRCVAGILILAYGSPKLADVQELSLFSLVIAAVSVGVVLATRREYVKQLRVALGGAPEPVAEDVALDRRARAGVRTDLGYELLRYARALEKVTIRNGQNWRGTWGEQADRSRNRIYELAGRLYGSSDFALAGAGLEQGDTRIKSLALELLDNVTDIRLGKLLVRAMDHDRTAAERAAAARAALDRMGNLPRRPEARVSWSVHFAR